MTVFGPYIRSDGRTHVIHYDPITQTRRTQSYPRYLMEQHLGRTLKEWEQVDHINNDHTDDRIENFQLLTKGDNNRKSAKAPKLYWFICPVCGEEGVIYYRNYKGNQLSQGKAGPYCSRRCAGIAHH
jgi:hypothetical protein